MMMKNNDDDVTVDNGSDGEYCGQGDNDDCSDCSVLPSLEKRQGALICRSQYSS